MKIRLLLIFIVFVASLNAQTTYYFSTSGNDGNNGLSSGSAKQTMSELQNLLNSSVPGDRFLLKSGDIWTTGAHIYKACGGNGPSSGYIGLDLSAVQGTSGSYIIIDTYGGTDYATLDFDASDCVSIIDVDGCNYTNVNNIRCTSSAPYGSRPHNGVFELCGDNGGAKYVNFNYCMFDHLAENGALLNIQGDDEHISFNYCNFNNNFNDEATEGSTYAMGIFATITHLTISHCYFEANGKTTSGGDPDGHDHDIYLQYADYAMIEYNTFVGTSPPRRSSIKLHGDNITIRYNTCYGSDWSQLTFGSYNSASHPTEPANNILIEGNNFYNCRRGIDIKPQGSPYGTGIVDGAIIINNLIHDLTDADGIAIQDENFSNAIIANNTIVNPGSSAYSTCILFAGTCTYSNVIAKNNIFYNNSTGTLLQIDNSNDLSNISLNNNLYYSIVGSNIKVGDINYLLSGFHSVFSQELNGISGDPLFTNPSALDFHINSNSPAIDKGVTLTNVTNDFDGNSRPAGSGYDIGAYEYGSTAGTSLGTKLNIKILLEGPFNNGSMSTNLLTDGYISLTQPYNARSLELCRYGISFFNSFRCSRLGFVGIKKWNSFFNSHIT